MPSYGVSRHCGSEYCRTRWVKPNTCVTGCDYDNLVTEYVHNSGTAVRHQSKFLQLFFALTKIHQRTMLRQLFTCLAVLALTYAAGGQQTADVIPGAPISTDDVEYLDFAVKKVRSYFKDTKDDIPDSIKLIGATTQVVAGIRYEYYFLVASPNGRYDLCQVSVWVRPWLSKDYITQLDDPIKCGLPESVVESLEKIFNDRSNSLTYAKISGQVNITMQGAYIKVENVPLTKTTCTKDDFNNGQLCDFPDNAKPEYHCSAKLVWSNNGFSIVDFESENY
ncbi:hypothetical protein RRG08_035789 [Elysia crispata]|uniref:Cystatin domain-containing protein n=1 Tax=Elysia crispata TaxID=231223 RepID=A0AAE1DI92_9GAST|nr:hypothetical protein RRG08_035789 [Elysia crispata]